MVYEKDTLETASDSLECCQDTDRRLFEPPPDHRALGARVTEVRLKTAFARRTCLLSLTTWGLLTFSHYLDTSRPLRSTSKSRLYTWEEKGKS
jgi:hypothetical protein